MPGKKLSANSAAAYRPMPIHLKNANIGPIYRPDDISVDP